MKRILLSALVALAASGSASALENYYVNIGAGALYPNHNGSTSSNTNRVIYSPNEFGEGLYQIQNLQWKSRYNNATDFNLALGADISANFRVEAEFLYQKMTRKLSGMYDWVQLERGSGDVFDSQFGVPLTANSSKVNIYSLLANIFYDFKNSTKLTPFIGFGIGASTIHTQAPTATGRLLLDNFTLGTQELAPTQQNGPGYSAKAFAAQLKLGLGYQFSKHFSVVGEYRLFMTTPFPTSTTAVITNPGTPVQAVYNANNRDISGIVSNGFDINLRYTI